MLEDSDGIKCFYIETTFMVVIHQSFNVFITEPEFSKNNLNSKK